MGLEVIASYQQSGQQQTGQQQGNQHQFRVVPPTRSRLLHIGLMEKQEEKNTSEEKRILSYQVLNRLKLTRDAEVKVNIVCN